MMDKPDLAGVPNRQQGWSQVETLLAGFLGFVLVLSGGYLFKNQIGEYHDIKNQAEMQAGFKKALQGMSRQIPNAGGFVPDRKDFSIQPGGFTFAYMDWLGHSCPGRSIVVVSYYVKSGNQEDALMEDIACKTGPSQSRVLASASHGGLDLSFRYLDKNGFPTVNPALMKAVDVDLVMENGKTGLHPRWSRHQTIRIQCPNL
jgi:hypothetical protein